MIMLFYYSIYIIYLYYTSLARIAIMLNIKSTEIHINKKCRAGNLLFRFQSESLVFCPKMSKWAIRSKKWAIHSFTNFWWATWAIRSQSLISSERHERIAYDHSFLVSDLSDSLTIAHFLWATWVNRLWSLIFSERPEWFAHIAHLWWATWAIHSHCSPKYRKWAIW